MNVETSDFYLSAYLRLEGKELIDLKDMGQRRLFVFEDDEEFQLLKQQYYFSQAMVDPLAFKKAIRELKGLCMNL